MAFRSRHLHVEPHGVVTSRFFEQAYQERVTVGSMMARLGADVDVPATTVTSPQLEMTSYDGYDSGARDAIFSGAGRAAVSRRASVYAPGVAGYTPIAFSVEAHRGCSCTRREYPPSEMYQFKPLNEHVQVYQRPFRIVQDVTIDPSSQGMAALKDSRHQPAPRHAAYQACDDKVCFTPQTVPLAWTIGLRSLDRERAVR